MAAIIQNGRQPNLDIILDIILKLSYCLDWGVADQGIQCQTSLYFQMIFDVFLISIV